MYHVKLWMVSGLMAALLFAAASVSQPLEPKDGSPPPIGQPARLGVADIVERLLAFDKNKDGKITTDELPERMQHLIAHGDANKDGALDKDEIMKLAANPGTVGGRGEVGAFGQGGVTIGPGLPGPGRAVTSVAPGPLNPGLGRIDGVVNDLKLSGKKKDRAEAVVKAHQDEVRRLLDQARTELLEKMKEILSEEEFKDFKAALDRPGGGQTFFTVGPPDGPRPKR